MDWEEDAVERVGGEQGVADVLYIEGYRMGQEIGRQKALGSSKVGL